MYWQFYFLEDIAIFTHTQSYKFSRLQFQVDNPDIYPSRGNLATEWLPDRSIARMKVRKLPRLWTRIRFAFSIWLPESFAFSRRLPDNSLSRSQHFHFGAVTQKGVYICIWLALHFLFEHISLSPDNTCVLSKWLRSSKSRQSPYYSFLFSWWAQVFVSLQDASPSIIPSLNIRKLSTPEGVQKHPVTRRLCTSGGQYCPQLMCLPNSPPGHEKWNGRTQNVPVNHG